MMTRDSKITQHFIKFGLGLGGLYLSEKIYEKIYYLTNSLLKNPTNELKLDNYPVRTDLSWLTEVDYEHQINKLVMPILRDHRITGSFSNDDLTFYYDYYRVENPIASILIVHGFNEYKEKYTEFIYYLLQMKIEVFVFDQRGHGFSKANEEVTRVDIENFDTYIQDLKIFVEKIVVPYAQSKCKVLFGHSMGGAIVTSFAQTYPDDFDKLILNAPMLAIDTGKVAEPLAYLFAKMCTSLNSGHHHLPTTEKYDIQKSRIFQEDSTVSKNTARAKFYHNLNFNLHLHPTRGGSINWLKASLEATNKITRPNNLQKIQADTLIIRAEADKVVNKAGIFQAQHYIPQVQNVCLPLADHEMSGEHDLNIQRYYSCLINYILS